MKRSIYFSAFFLLFAYLPALQGADAEYGKIRALQQRAAHIIRQKNDYISRVLTSHSIPHKCNAEGVVVSISMDGRWLQVTKIEIIPLLMEGADKGQRVAAHELLFYTEEGMLTLDSELTLH